MNAPPPSSMRSRGHRTHCWRRVLFATTLALVTAHPSQAATTLRRAVFGLGGTGGTSAHHALRGTLGQPAAISVSAPLHTLHAGFWHPGNTPSDVAHDTPLPREFALRSVSPNPFSGSTEIHFDIPADGGRVALRVFDIHGRLVRTLANGPAAPGKQLTVWDGSDEAGHQLGVGVYLLSFEAPGRKTSKKLVLLP